MGHVLLITVNQYEHVSVGIVYYAYIIISLKYVLDETFAMDV